MSIQTQIDRLNNVKSLIKTAIADKDVDIPADAKLDRCAEYISQIESKHADTVDGWHFEVRSEDPPSGTVATISLVYTGG